MSQGATRDVNRDVVAYLLYKLGCTHPFKLSRLLALADIESIEKRGKRVSTFKYVCGPGTFYIEGLKELFEGECFETHKGKPEEGVKGCVSYTCGEPRLPDDIKEIIDNVIDKYASLDDFKLNDIVIKNNTFKRLAAGGSSCS